MSPCPSLKVIREHSLTTSPTCLDYDQKMVTIPTLVLAVIILADFAYPNATVNPTRPGGAVILGCEPQDIGVLRLAIENPRETQRQLLGAC